VSARLAHRIVVLLAVSVVLPASAYDLGSMTCDDMGTYAAEAMRARSAGTAKEDFVAALEQRTFKADVEKRNLQDVAALIYGRLGSQLFDDKAAFAVIKTDCLTASKR